MEEADAAVLEQPDGEDGEGEEQDEGEEAHAVLPVALLRLLLGGELLHGAAAAAAPLRSPQPAGCQQEKREHRQPAAQGQSHGGGGSGCGGSQSHTRGSGDPRALPTARPAEEGGREGAAQEPARCRLPRPLKGAAPPAAAAAAGERGLVRRGDAVPSWPPPPGGGEAAGGSGARGGR